MSRERTDTKKGGCLRKVGIGCLTLVILLAVGGVLVYRTARSTVTRLAARYTERRADRVAGISDGGRRETRVV